VDPQPAGSSIGRSNRTDPADRFRSTLLEWWAVGRKDYPWRSAENRFHKLIAEILLRKTNRTKVERFIGPVLEALKTPEDAAAADPSQLEQLLKPFGMQSVKARQISQLGRVVTEQYGGCIPEAYSELVRLPGIGPYVANAYLCFALGQRRPLIDPNVLRLFERYFGFRSSRSRPRTDPAVWAFAERLLPDRDWVQFNYALIDFAGAVCTRRNPKCPECPLRECCAYAARPPAH
jgi:A/G-specific adenine glycosylase